MERWLESDFDEVDGSPGDVVVDLWVVDKPGCQGQRFGCVFPGAGPLRIFQGSTASTITRHTSLGLR
jgi:hypothetical protein